MRWTAVVMSSSGENEKNDRERVRERVRERADREGDKTEVVVPIRREAAGRRRPRGAQRAGEKGGEQLSVRLTGGPGLVKISENATRLA